MGSGSGPWPQLTFAHYSCYVSRFQKINLHPFSGRVAERLPGRVTVQSAIKTGKTLNLHWVPAWDPHLIWVFPTAWDASELTEICWSTIEPFRKPISSSQWATLGRCVVKYSNDGVVEGGSSEHPIISTRRAMALFQVCGLILTLLASNGVLNTCLTGVKGSMDPSILVYNRKSLHNMRKSVTPKYLRAWGSFIVQDIVEVGTVIRTVENHVAGNVFVVNWTSLDYHSVDGLLYSEVHFEILVLKYLEICEFKGKTGFAAELVVWKE